MNKPTFDTTGMVPGPYKDTWVRATEIRTDSRDVPSFQHKLFTGEARGEVTRTDDTRAPDKIAQARARDRARSVNAWRSDNNSPHDPSTPANAAKAEEMARDELAKAAALAQGDRSKPGNLIAKAMGRVEATSYQTPDPSADQSNMASTNGPQAGAVGTRIVTLPGGRVTRV
jgi:hypothetical protein